MTTHFYEVFVLSLTFLTNHRSYGQRKELKVVLIELISYLKAGDQSQEGNWSLDEIRKYVLP